MPESVVVVRCPSCSQKYRVSRSAVGRKARCAKCKHAFVVGARTVFDEDTILSWIAEEDQSSESVMGSTGLFHAAANAVSTASHPPADHVHRTPQHEESGQGGEAGVGVQLRRMNDEGAQFEFPVSALGREELRDSFPRKCVGCAARHGLWVHLVYWPDRMRSEEAVHWRDYQNTAVGDWDQFARLDRWLRRLPRTRHCRPPFDAPFPFLTCRHCVAASQVQGRAPQDLGGSCILVIRSLATAVDFFRNNGGRHTPEYQRLIEHRDIRHDRRNELAPEVRSRLSHWFTPLAGEQFVHYFPDAEFSAAEAGTAGAVLTVRRLVFKKFAAYRDYSLHLPCRMEIKSVGRHTQLHVVEEGHRPAVLHLSASDASQLVLALKSLNCRWTISR